MEENQNPEPAQPSTPSDIAAFFDALPVIVGSFAAKHNEAVTAAKLAVDLARETTGQFATLGLCDQTTICTDGLPLAIIGNVPSQGQSDIPRNLGQGLGNGHSKQGAVVAQFQNQSIQKIQGL
ncbi:MAG TPA: hypothetical protein VFA98_12830 [Thermoanaerobaculia bacterium]|jgi:hypothetical protein|nr:hypothetical protein [Thermoanaerobaculia bacterium]